MSNTCIKVRICANPNCNNITHNHSKLCPTCIALGVDPMDYERGDQAVIHLGRKAGSAFQSIREAFQPRSSTPENSRISLDEDLHEAMTVVSELAPISVAQLRQYAAEYPANSYWRNDENGRTNMFGRSKKVDWRN